MPKRVEDLSNEQVEGGQLAYALYARMLDADENSVADVRDLLNQMHAVLGSHGAMLSTVLATTNALLSALEVRPEDARAVAAEVARRRV